MTFFRIFLLFISFIPGLVLFPICTRCSKYDDWTNCFSRLWQNILCTRTHRHRTRLAVVPPAGPITQRSWEGRVHGHGVVRRYRRRVFEDGSTGQHNRMPFVSGSPLSSRRDNVIRRWRRHCRSPERASRLGLTQSSDWPKRLISTAKPYTA